MQFVPIERGNANSQFMQQMRKKGLRVAFVHSGGPASGGNRIFSVAARQFIQSEIPVIAFLNGFKNPLKVEINKLTKGVHFIPANEELIRRGMIENALLFKTARDNPGKLSEDLEIKAPEDLNNLEKMAGIDKVLDVLEALRIGALGSFGGDDTLKVSNYVNLRAQMRSSDRLFRGTVHGPKTIDNDLPGIPWTYGYFSALDAAISSIDGFYHDGIATDVYHVIKLMGRNAGWITSGVVMNGRIAKACIPEELKGGVFDLHNFIEETVDIVIEREKRGVGGGVICIAEGLIDRLPKAMTQDAQKDEHGHTLFLAMHLEEAIAKYCGERYRVKTGKKKDFKAHELGHQLRQVAPSSYDQVLTAQIGLGLFDLIANGQFGRMISVHDAPDGTNNMGLYSIGYEELIDSMTLKVITRNIDPNSDYFRLYKTMQNMI
ncbi:hypothetical protein A3J90_00600 [candidate division WOR-1 bacterium RIFOXYC2_FULL_37_10]|uniref:Phosphofructokinase domain-containing protein n=1 Tax=candidate division WOR-1 bacterium RIFOXYB2_FULL_37_13 TaxID=1802579 RepID=A0A1F4SMU0_UNCSA|nr:MAG: hypothetical protein A2310_00645 [candidate division WOR-1 bacterium RIFOXYB2_FULL_37_13]OGC36685.1 MAG: hypothetical protein A3J90_00600 [candidate division WOR-1 bacterium RIFOXYC2_FULL_37_10]